MHERELVVSVGLEWATQLRHFKMGNYPSWTILAHGPVEITGSRANAMVTGGEFPCDYIASDVFVRKRDWYKLGVYIKVQAKW